jgi:KDO2-lipid IV(A) lauroyltransferase
VKVFFSDDIFESVQAINAAVEDCIREAPEQYQWEYKRFKKQPDGSEFY